MKLLNAGDKYAGALLGGAVGDALGAQIEHVHVDMRAHDLRSEAVTGMAASRGRLNAITDDTQLTLFMAEAAIRANHQKRRRGDADYLTYYAQSLLRWVDTQGEPNCYCSYPVNGLLFEQEELFSRRQPGPTCLNSLTTMSVVGEPACNDSCGSGAVVRVAPIALSLFAEDEESASQRAFEVGMATAALTHGHISAHLSAGFFASWLAMLLDNIQPIDAALQCLDRVRQIPGNREATEAIERALTAVLCPNPRRYTVDDFGEGWVAHEALAIGLFCALSYPDPKTALLASVNHPGDSDTTGAITGTIAGVLQGVEMLPTEWLRRLELAHVLRQVAEDLSLAPDWRVNDQRFRERYCVY